MSEKRLESLNDLVSLCKRRGFIFQSSEIYGGMGGAWDYGPLGVELKNNVKAAWWKAMTYRPDVEGIDSAIFMHPQTWKASGHVDGFSDPMVDCKSCKFRFRADQIELSAPCPNCKAEGEFTEPRDFNLMFSTQVGPVANDGSLAYLRPETAQGIFVNFLNVQGSMRKKLPFGIAQIGKAFRNEITPGNFIFRTREFEQMEMQYFVQPGRQKEFMQQWMETRMEWHKSLGIEASRLRFDEHPSDKLAHYADAAFDIEYEFPIGWQEIEGIHSRTDFDLKQHQEHSKKNLQYVDQADGNKKYLPYVIETSVGCDRSLLAVICDAFRIEYPGDKEKERTVLKVKPQLAPIKAAVLPLQKKPAIEEMAQKLFSEIQVQHKSEYDLSGSIGKRYRRQDEIGTPYCLTVDFDSLDDKAVTIRDRDTMSQERVSLDKVSEFLNNKLN